MHPFHPFWSLEVPRVDGQLLLTPCPGTQQVPLTLALDQLRFAGAHGVITLMTRAELVRFELAHLGQQVEREGMRWFHLPIEDDKAPDAAFEQAWQLVLPQLIDLLRDGKHLVIHCKGGSGRTGLMAATLLLSLGQPLDEAMAAIKAHRPKAFTLAVHRQWLDQLAERLDRND
ncbi:cyclin-dependent kinase inhibitor 3 family protein [Aeromonas finlandensis]|uniref:cyclin-dependent kinase inhibitor 3 family protein n=1 Tax=Aeromonas finlandensis TaxID=1543375 RepID=UPI00051C5245|nr:cyclin-dependent kinase inhibitor 3 family protein [Aeromonas finlandensis]